MFSRKSTTGRLTGLVQNFTKTNYTTELTKQVKGEIKYQKDDEGTKTQMIE